MQTTTKARAVKLWLTGMAWLTCSLVGGTLSVGGAVVFLLVSAFAFTEWAGYGQMVFLTWGAAAAGCVVAGVLLLGCGKYLRSPALER